MLYDLRILVTVTGSRVGRHNCIVIIFYWINDSGPRIYNMDPVPVEPGDTITYWSLDRNGNLEWRQGGDILKFSHRAPNAAATASSGDPATDTCSPRDQLWSATTGRPTLSARPISERVPYSPPTTSPEHTTAR